MWFANPVLLRHILLQVGHFRSVSDFSFSFLRSFLPFASVSLKWFKSWSLELISLHQRFLFKAFVLHVETISKLLRSAFTTSYHRCFCFPFSLLPALILLTSSCFGRRKFSILCMWPSHLSRLRRSKVSMRSMFARFQCFLFYQEETNLK